MPEIELARLLYLAGFALILVGIVVLIVNTFFYKKEAKRGEIGGVIFIGPFPIIFGTSRRMVKIMLITVFAFVVVILLALLLPQVI